MVRWTEEEYEAYKAKQHGQKMDQANKTTKLHKFGAKPTWVDGIWFPSKKEAARYSDLKLLWMSGAVLYFDCQVAFELNEVNVDGDKPVIYYLDFLVTWDDGSITFEDVKGMRTKEYKIKKRLFESMYPFKITEN